MASSSMMKQNPRVVSQVRDSSPTHGANPDPTPTNSTHRSETSLKRFQARGNLTTQLKDRTAPLPLKLTRSLTDANISKYKSKNAGLNARQSYGRRSNLPGASTRKMERPTQYEHSVEEFLYNGRLQGREKTTMEAVPETEGGMPKEFIKHVTIAELHKILETTKTKRGAADDMKIVIDSVPNAYPNIKLTFKDQDLFHEQQKGVKLPAVGPVSAGHLHKSAQNNLSRKPSMIDSSRGRINELAMTTKACLAVLDKSQVTPNERTKKWIHSNPLGPTDNEEYDDNTVSAEPMMIRSMQTDSRFKPASTPDAVSQSASSITTRRTGQNAGQNQLSGTTWIREPSPSGQWPGSLQPQANMEQPTQETPVGPDKKKKEKRKVRFGTDQFLLSDPYNRHDVFDT